MKRTYLYLWILWLFCMPFPLWAQTCAYWSEQGAYLEHSNDTTAAVEAYETALKADPSCLNARLSLARMYASRGEWKAAEKQLYRATRLAPERLDISFRLSEAFLAQKKNTWALRTLKKLSPSSPADRNRWNYLMGLVSMELGDPKTALTHFRAIPKKSSKSLPLLDFYKGQAFLFTGETGEARNAFTRFLDDPASDPRFHEAARQLLERTYGDDAADPWLDLRITLGLQYDSNVVQQPDDQPLDGGKSPGSPAVTAGASLAFSPLRTPRHLAGVDLSFNRSTYFTDPANDFSSTSGTWSARYRHRFHGFGRDQEAYAGYTGALSLLDGGAKADEDSLYLYSETHSGWVKWLIKEDDFGETTVRGGFGRNLYRLLGRNNWSGNGSLGQSFFFLDQKLKLFLEMTGRFEDARRADYDRWSLGPFGGLSASIPGGILLNFWSRYEYIDHFHSDESVSWGQKREDHRISGGAGAAYPFLDDFEVGLNYSLVTNLSSVSFYDYSRHTVSLLFSWRQSW